MRDLPAKDVVCSRLSAGQVFVSSNGSLSHVQITPAVETGMDREAEQAESSICAGSSTVELPLFQRDDGGSSPTSALQFLIRKINLPTATKFVERWHYSHKITGGQVVCFGLFADGILYAVIVFGMGCNRFQAPFLGVKTFMEIKRMCRREPKMNYELSRFIAISTRMLRREYEFECVLAFADPEHGHEGHVYKGAGFVLHGMTQAEWHLEDEKGRRVHRRLAHRWAKKEGIKQEQCRQKHGLRRVRTLPKYRWVKMIGRAAGDDMNAPHQATVSDGHS